MLQSWRWFGPNDPVTLREIRQAGVTDIVTALHHVKCGEPWTEAEIAKRVREVEWDEKRNRPTGLKWSVVESVAIHEDIKTRSGNWRGYVEVYKQNLRNLAKAGIKIICYNFMPVLDWTRTDLKRELPDGSSVLYCDGDGVAAFDLFILKRPGAEKCYTDAEKSAAAELYNRLDAAGRKALGDSILLGLPGTVDDLTPEEFLQYLRRYDGIDDAKLRRNLYDFLNEIMPLCEELGILMAIHPDDPPRPIFGLPRIMSTAADVEQMFREVPSPNCGLTLCTGSFGGRRDNNPAEMLEKYAARVHFIHFRNVTFVPGKEKSFYESNHLYGHVDMARAMKALINEEERRKAAGLREWRIPVRPDHGKLMDGDLGSKSYAGYSRMGRMIGISELRGLECGLRYAMGLAPLPVT